MSLANSVRGDGCCRYGSALTKLALCGHLRWMSIQRRPWLGWRLGVRCATAGCRLVTVSGRALPANCPRFGVLARSEPRTGGNLRRDPGGVYGRRGRGPGPAAEFGVVLATPNAPEPRAGLPSSGRRGHSGIFRTYRDAYGRAARLGSRALLPRAARWARRGYRIRCRRRPRR